MMLFRCLINFTFIQLLLLSCLSFAQEGQITQTNIDPSTLSFLRTKSVTDSVCGSTPNYGTGPQCGEPTITFAAKSTSACNPILAQDSRCPPAEYYRGRANTCPPEILALNTGAVCGTEPHEFWSGWDEGCPSITIIDGIGGPVAVSLSAGESEYRVHRSGFSVTIQTRTKCIGKKNRTCRHRDFGVELYQECDIAPKSYQTCTVGYETCRHPNHGEEGRVYPGCRHETFGLSPKTCVIPDLEMQNQEIEAFANELGAYKLAINAIKNSDNAAKATLSSTAIIIESSIETLTFREAELTRKIESSEPSENIDNLKTMRSELRENIAELNRAFKQIEQCTAATSECDLNSINITLILDTQIKRVQSDLMLIKNFLIKEAARWRGVSESLHSQIIKILNSPQLKDAA